ncbi:serine peptidase inhibitor, Kazal type 4 [Betta splendens]|uniref:Serine peptidase inhibitor, Kazal type 4 n=1 Tax=Betta splendens TaxID=158456 RepID=A0A6P7NQ53_BETSP|nr:serine peptidase inhibitor, Kazal type 4 [Betta splendens]
MNVSLSKLTHDYAFLNCACDCAFASTCCIPTPTPTTRTKPHSYLSLGHSFPNMAGRVVVVLLGLLLVCVATDTKEKFRHMRKPSCPEDVMACPLNLAPVCGSDGNTYANECTLCAQSYRVKMEIFVAKETSC